MGAKSKFRITNEIRAILLSNPKIVALIGNRIFPLVAPEGTTGDFIAYQRDEYSIDRTKMGIASQKCRVFINAVSEDYDRSQDLAVLIHETLEGIYTTPDMTIYLEDSTEDYEDKKNIQILSFLIE